MARYMYVYKGEATDMSEMTPEEGQAIMEKWGAWMGKIGNALVDVGAPYGPGSSLVDDGSTGAASASTGYSIVEADDMAHAQSLADGHPYLSEGNGNYAIDIFELMPVPFEN